MRIFTLLNFVNFVSFVFGPLFFTPFAFFAVKNPSAARHFKKLRSKALSILTFCCMPLLVNHWA